MQILSKIRPDRLLADPVFCLIVDLFFYVFDRTLLLGALPDGFIQNLFPESEILWRGLNVLIDVDVL